MQQTATLTRPADPRPDASDRVRRRIREAVAGIAHLDSARIAALLESLPDHTGQGEAMEIAIRGAAALVAEEPEYEQVAARLLSRLIDDELAAQGLDSFSTAVRRGAEVGLIGDRLLHRLDREGDELDAILDRAHDDRFRYFGLRTLYDRYLLRHPTTRAVIEGPQHFFLRAAAALTTDLEDTRELYEAFAALSYLPSSPTLFNAGTRHEQLSSCFLLDSPDDSLEGIYERYRDVAMLSKFSGGIGIAYHRVRSRGSLIRSTNGRSNGIVPWLKTLDSSVAAVNQGGKRRGACCVYLEPWHADIEEFLELRDNTGDEARRAHNLNLANWIPDLFMRRVEADASWSLFDPTTVPELPDLYGAAFERAYVEAEDAGLAVRTLPARALYRRMMRALAETGNGWMTFKDRSNALCNQTARRGRVVNLSNLCTEIVEVTGPGETAVCNLGSINLVAHVTDGEFDFGKLRRTVRTAVRQLDRVIDLNLYPVAEASSSNARWRPVGLGVMGLQDVFFELRLAFDAPEALELSTKIQEEIYLTALETSAELAEARRPHPAFDETRAAQGILQPDLWGVEPSDRARYAALKMRIREHGLRNSLLLAIAPTATIASIAGCYECIEPQVSNLFKRETLSGEFLRVNRYLVDELRALGLWTDEMRARLRDADGSVQALGELPAGVRRLYRTAWELSQKTLLDLAAARGPFIDQSQSLNLFMESPTLGALSSMYMYAWKVGLKTTYYLRSRPATRIAKATLSAALCSLENPETCEACPVSLLDPGLDLTLRPMRYPAFYEMYRAAIRNTWTVEEVDFSTDVADLTDRMTEGDRHLVKRLVAFFATGDSIVSNNLVLNLYRHLNAPEARMYLSRQLYEEALHVQFYLTLLDTYLPSPEERAEAFAAVETIPSIRRKATFCAKWMDSVRDVDALLTVADRRRFLLNLICFAACIEGLFFFAAFAYVYFLRSRGLLHGLAAGTNWVFRDESAHMAFAFEAVRVIRAEEPELFDADLERAIVEMIEEAIECELAFADDLLSGGVLGLHRDDVRRYLEHCADQRLRTLGIAPRYGSDNPFAFMALQDVQEFANFFERRVSAYQVGVAGEVVFDAKF